MLIMEVRETQLPTSYIGGGKDLEVEIFEA